jgi:ABC-type branched-subunit amino acid transport system permease subunit
VSATREEPAGTRVASRGGLTLSGRSPGWWLGAAALVLGLVVLVLAPTYLLLESEQRTLGSVFMFVVLAQGWNLIGGFAGYPSFGNVVFFGLGGYTTAVLMAKAGASFWITVPAAAAVGLGFAVLMGFRFCASRATTSPSPPWAWPKARARW